jgi:hypothetical protein
MGWYPLQEWREGGAGAPAGFGYAGYAGGGAAGPDVLGLLEHRVAQLEHALRLDRLLAGGASALGARVETRHIVENPTYRTVNVALAGGGSQIIRYLGTA